MINTQSNCQWLKTPWRPKVVKTIMWYNHNEQSTTKLCWWWRHQMETFSILLGLCEGNLPVVDEFPSQRPVTHSFDVFFYLHLNKRLSKQSRRLWIETPMLPLWRHSILYHGTCICILRQILGIVDNELWSGGLISSPGDDREARGPDFQLHRSTITRASIDRICSYILLRREYRRLKTQKLWSITCRCGNFSIKTVFPGIRFPSWRQEGREIFLNLYCEFLYW